ncbi:MAG: DUF349 domain-containing protein [Cytophagales bacterium]|nr:DUF349 domain-containing protein [Cytophagales bacterium]
MHEPLSAPAEEVIEEISHETVLHEDTDYAAYTLADFKKLIEKLIKENNLNETYFTSKKIRPYVESLLESEKNSALDKFLSDGGEADDFEYKADPFYKKFEDLTYRSKKEYSQNQKDTQHKKEQNTKLKLDIIEKMRAILDKPETRKAYEDFKILQNEWKNIGPVPAERSEEIWKSYNGLVSRFYDLRSISFELLELDRKKNLELKIALCDKAQKLENEPNIKKALHELEVIHDEFRHLGPVPRDRQDEIWQRLKESSDKIHQRKKEYIEEQNSRLSQNLTEKQNLIAKLQPYTTLEISRADEWTQKTKEVELIQEEWNKAGLVPNEHVKDINHQYWEALKKFYAIKRNYFKESEKIKKENLRLKTELCEKAESMAVSTNWEATTAQVIQLQKDWKEIGHVPLKFKDKIYERFKKACDMFFENKRNAGKQKQNAAKENLKVRYDFCDKIEKQSAITSLEDIAQILTEWNELSDKEEEGLDANKAWNRFATALRHKLTDVKTINEITKDEIVTKIIVQAIKFLPNASQELLFKEKKLRKDIRDIEDTIAQYNNNMEFFARAKNGDAIRKEFTDKIEIEKDKLAIAKSRLKVLLQK